MRYFAKYNEDGTLLAIGTGAGGAEISETEYNDALRVIREKTDLVNRLIAGTVMLKDVPAEWRGEIERRASEKLNRMQNEEISADEALEILMGGVADDA